jgi:uridine phosphorylase
MENAVAHAPLESTRIAESELILTAKGALYHLGMQPHHLADKVLTVGDPDRVKMISRYFTDVEFISRKREYTICTGWCHGKRLTAMSTGMGTDNVEIALTELDALVNINLETRQIKPTLRQLEIVRIGTSGALQHDIGIETELASVQALGLDSLMHFYQLPQSTAERGLAKQFQKEIGLGFTPYVASASPELLARIGHDMIQGFTLTCPGFYAPQGRVLRAATQITDAVHGYSRFRYQNSRLTNFEMETAGYYAMGRILGHQVLSLNAIVAHRLTHEFSNNIEVTLDKLIQKVLLRI